MASSLKISYAQIPFNSVSITPSVAADTNNNEWNLVAGPRYQRFFYGSAATSRSTVYDIGTTYASKDSTVDHLLVARADFLQDDGTTTITLASSPDNATWTDRIASSTVATDTLTGPRANDLVIAGGPPVIGGCKLWLDATKGVTKDGSNLVSQWNDQSGNGNHATQGTGANQPTWTDSAINGLPAISFDGTADYLSANGVAATFAGDDKPFTLMMAFKKTTNAGSDVLFSFANSGSATPSCQLYTDASADFGIYRRDDASGSATQAAGAPDTTTTVLSGVFSGTTISCWINGSNIINAASLNTGTAAFNTCTIGANVSTTTTNYANMQVCEVALFDSALGTTDRQTIEAYLTAKWITSPSTTQILESPQARYWRVTYSGSSQVYRHSKCYFGKFFTFDYDPTYEIDFIPAKDSVWYAGSGAAHFVRPGDPIYRITLTATAMSDTNVKSFEDKIARYAHRTPVFLHDIKVPEVLNNVSPIHAWLVDYSVEKVAYNYNQMTMVFEEALG